MIVIHPTIVRDAMLTFLFWTGYAVGLIRGFTPMIVHKLPLLH